MQDASDDLLSIRKQSRSIYTGQDRKVPENPHEKNFEEPTCPNQKYFQSSCTPDLPTGRSPQHVIRQLIRHGYATVMGRRTCQRVKREFQPFLRRRISPSDVRQIDKNGFLLIFPHYCLSGTGSASQLRLLARILFFDGKKSNPGLYRPWKKPYCTVFWEIVTFGQDQARFPGSVSDGEWALRECIFPQVFRRDDLRRETDR